MLIRKTLKVPESNEGAFLLSLEVAQNDLNWRIYTVNSDILSQHLELCRKIH